MAETEIDQIVATLTAKRRQSGMSMRAIARLADVSPSCVHSWEHGTRDPSLHNLHAWARALGYDLTLLAAPVPHPAATDPSDGGGGRGAE